MSREFWHRVEMTDGSSFVVHCTEATAGVNARFGAGQREVRSVVREEPYWPAWTDEEVEAENGRTTALLAILGQHANRPTRRREVAVRAIRTNVDRQCHDRCGQGYGRHRRTGPQGIGGRTC